MFKSNINIGLSTFHKTNIFINDIDSDKQTCFDNTIFVDIHPLYGFNDNKTVSYIWSHGFYLMNPYHFHSFVNLYAKESEDNNHISFFITNNSMVKFTEESLQKVSENIDYIKKVYPSKTLQYLTYIECESLKELMKKHDIVRVFDYNIFFNCLFVITNTYSTIFMLAYEFKRYVRIIGNNDETHYLSEFFLNEQSEHHAKINSMVRQRIQFFSAYLKYFTVQSLNDIQYIYNPIIKKFLNIEFKYTRNVSILKQNTYNNVYVHSDCGMYFQTLVNAVSKSSMQLTNRYQDNTLVCIIMSEINLSKRLTKSVTNIIGFDINPCVTLTKDCKTKYYRYYISSFNNTQCVIPQKNNNTHHFMFNDETMIHENGIIFCYLDNSNGLFYTTPKEWSDIWIDILDFLTEKYDNKVCLKIHPNDVENKMLMNMVNRYEKYGNKVHITQSSLEDLRDNIYFCVINHGSLYFRCMQLGVLLFSPKYNEKKCIYDLHSEENIDEIVLKYQKERHDNFKTVVSNELISYDDLKCGHFFSLLHSCLSC
jgi:hypothetical protein